MPASRCRQGPVMGLVSTRSKRGCTGFPLQVHPNGNLVAAGYTSSSLDGYTNAGSNDVLLMSFDSTGAWQWTVQRGGSRVVPASLV